jgi:hypothetical protein
MLPQGADFRLMIRRSEVQIPPVDVYSRAEIFAQAEPPSFDGVDQRPGLNCLLKLVVRWVDVGAILHLAKDSSKLLPNLVTTLVPSLEESKGLFGDLADARVLASADPFLSKGLKVVRKCNYLGSVR